MGSKMVSMNERIGGEQERNMSVITRNVFNKSEICFSTPDENPD